MGKRYTEEDLRDFDPVWLLELTLGGVVYRFASQTISVPTDDSAYLYHGTLGAVSFTSEVEFASEDFELPSAGVEVTFREDLAERIAQGVDLGAATAELSLFRKDSEDDYDDRQVLISGRVDAPAYGAVGEPVSLQIEADWLRDGTMYPQPGAAVDPAINWDDADPNAEGAVYPLIIGAPGIQNFSGSPVYVIDDGTSSGTIKALVAGHPCTAATIKVLRLKGANNTTSSLLNKALTVALDDSGIQYSYVVLSGAQYTAGDSYFAHFNEGGGGTINPFAKDRGAGTPAYLTGGGDLVRYLLHLSGSKVDEGKTAAAANLLNVYEFSGYKAERFNVMDFLRDEIMPLLPCSLRASSEGLYPVVWRYDATLSDVKAKLTADKDVYRDGLVEYEGTEVANEISLRYRHNAHFNKLTKQVTVTGDLAKKTSGFVWRNEYTVTSHSRYGLRALEFETEFVASRATAGRIVNWMSRAFSARHRRVRYLAPYKLGYLEAGDVVALTDAELSFQNQVALVQSIEWNDDGLAFDFLIIPDIPRDTKYPG